MPPSSATRPQSGSAEAKKAKTLMAAAPVGLLLAIVSFFAHSFSNVLLVMLLSMINVAGMYYGPKYGLEKGLLIITSSISGLIIQRYHLSSIWIAICAILSLSGYNILEQWNPPSPTESRQVPPGFPLKDDPFYTIPPNRQWLSLLLHSIIKHAAPMDVPQFDIGGRLPQFSTRTYEPIVSVESAAESPEKSTSSTGFRTVVDFEYKADDSTKIEVEIPMDIPLWGPLAVPVMVASPEIRGAIHLELRHEKIERKSDGGHVKVMALSFMFEPIKEIHIHGIHVSLASQFQLIQYVPIVKTFMKRAVDSALMPNTRRVLLFDSSFSSLGSFSLEEKDSNNWTIRGLLATMDTALEDAPNDDKIHAPVLDVSNSDPEAIRKAAISSPPTPAESSRLHGTSGSPNTVARGNNGGGTLGGYSSPEELNSGSSSSSSPHGSPSPILSSTEIQDDIDPSLLPSGNARELPPQEAAQYPRLQL